LTKQKFYIFDLNAIQGLFPDQDLIHLGLFYFGFNSFKAFFGFKTQRIHIPCPMEYSPPSQAHPEGPIKNQKPQNVNSESRNRNLSGQSLTLTNCYIT
jgi:hypothetical protein